MTHCDVLIVGGGPAGSAAARRAALGGARTVLIEQKRLPRPKLCGGWISNRALTQLGFDLPGSVIEHEFTAISLRHGDAGSDYMPGRALGVFVDRAVFDEHLVRVACENGAELIQATARALTPNGSGYHVETDRGTIAAHSVIVCTGANAALTEFCRPHDPDDWSGVCLEQRVPASFDDQLKVHPGEARLFFGDVTFGFGWVLHHGEYLIVGIGGRRSYELDIRRAFERFWRHLELPANLRSPKGHHIPLGGFKRTIGLDRVLCAGDAAGMVDAFSGEGIATAIESGQLAAQSVLASTKENPALTYQGLCRRSLGSEMTESLHAARLFHRLPKAVARRLCRDPMILPEYDLVSQRKANYYCLLRRAAWRLVTGRGKQKGSAVNTYEPNRNPATEGRAHAL